MRAKVIGFGEIELGGTRYASDVIVDGGRVRKCHKGPSKPLRAAYGHTPLTVAEEIPWGGRRLLVGTGADGALPIAPDVAAEARRRGVKLVAVPTAEACRLLRDVRRRDAFAVLHVTC